MERAILLVIGFILLAGPVAAIWYFALAAGFGYPPPPPPKADPNAPPRPLPPHYEGSGE